MNSERIHDALDLLDEELIEAVAKLRERKKQKPFRSLAAAAACLCVFLIGITVWQNIDHYDDVPDGDGGDAVIPNTDEEENLDGAPPEDGVVDEGADDNVYDDENENAHETVRDESTESQLASMLVRITKWNEDGFEGVVTEVMAGEFVSLRQRITVVFAKEINIKCGADDFKYDFDDPNASDCGISKGKVVKVYYSFRHEDVTAVAYIIENANE